MSHDDRNASADADRSAPADGDRNAPVDGGEGQEDRNAPADGGEGHSDSVSASGKRRWHRIINMNAVSREARGDAETSRCHR